jgi:hypothetical protein
MWEILKSLAEGFAALDEHSLPKRVVYWAGLVAAAALIRVGDPSFRRAHCRRFVT